MTMKRYRYVGTKITCDCPGCRASLTTPRQNSFDVWAEAKAIGWKSEKVNGVWKHFCSWIHYNTWKDSQSENE